MVHLLGFAKRTSTEEGARLERRSAFDKKKNYQTVIKLERFIYEYCVAHPMGNRWRLEDYVMTAPKHVVQEVLKEYPLFPRERYHATYADIVESLLAEGFPGDEFLLVYDGHSSKYAIRRETRQGKPYPSRWVKGRLKEEQAGARESHEPAYIGSDKKEKRAIRFDVVEEKDGLVFLVEQTLHPPFKNEKDSGRRVIIAELAPPEEAERFARVLNLPSQPQEWRDSIYTGRFKGVNTPASQLSIDYLKKLAFHLYSQAKSQAKERHPRLPF